jgi:Kef-type K+ transport system membrane component KefB
VLVLFFTFQPYAAATAAAGHGDPVAPLVLGLALLLLAAKLGGELATRLGQPPVLGELVAGVLLGNLRLLGVAADPFAPLANDAMVDMLARLGAVLLLFQVGLESTVKQMLQVGTQSFLVATVGVLAPLALGWGASAWLLPQQSGYAHAFVGATLCATSVGITARVLQDLGRSQTREARVIVGAAVIDDVLGLILLAVVTGMVTAAEQGTQWSALAIGAIFLKAVVFLVGALSVGVYVSPRLFSVASRLQVRGLLLAIGLCFCFVLAWLANAIGLAPIVGAFAAGLVLEDVHYRSFVDRGEHGLEELVAPIASFLVPVFFVVMGLRTDLRAFSQPSTLGLAAALTVFAVLGKQLCSLVVYGKGLDRWTVGLGMIPRGEVGLIFAGVGRELRYQGAPLLDERLFSAIVAMVILTTLATPPLLKGRLGRPAPPLTG